MNVKFGGLEEGVLLTELQELDKIRKQKKIIDDYMWKNLGKNKRINSMSVTKKKNGETFLLHPKRLTDSDSSESSSPKLNSSSSSASNFERDKVRLDTNTLNIKNNRTTLQKNLTYTKRNPFIYDTDLDIGDPSTLVQKRDDITNTNEENVNTLKKNQANNKNGPPPAPKIVITDDMFEKKCKSFIEKSLHVISDIRFQLQKGISPPDGDEDITRRQLRVKEFSNRFSRNYLYPIGRQLSDLNKVKFSSTLTNQKLLSAYQIVLNGLTAYHNHLPTSIGVCSSDKLKLLLKNLLELCDIHSRVKTDNQHDFCDFINIFRQSAEFTIEKIEDHFFAISTESMAKSHTTKNSLPQPKRPKNAATEGEKAKKNNLAARLSMYNTTSTFRRDAMWRKVTESVGAKKLRSVKSRYKTAAFRHRPPAEKIQDNMLRLPISKCNIFSKKSSGILKKTPVMTPINEDNITTMVQMEQLRSSTDDNEQMSTDHHHRQQHHQGQDGEAPQSQLHSQEDIVVQLLQLVLDINRRKAGGNGKGTEGKEPGSGATADKMAEVVEKLRKEGSVPEEALLRIAEELKTNNHKQQGQGDQQQLELKLVTFKGDTLDNSEKKKKKKKRKEPTVTVTGAKNAKLICIQDENSLDEESDSGAKDCETEDDDPLVKVVTSTSQTQTDLDENPKSDESTQRSALKMRRSMKKQPKYLKMLPKEYAVNVIQYKLDYKKYQKNNPMYRKTQNIVPWKLMGEMSDDILDEVLLGVTKEIELNEFLEPIYQSELQL